MSPNINYSQRDFCLSGSHFGAQDTVKGFADKHEEEHESGEEFYLFRMNKVDKNDLVTA